MSTAERTAHTVQHHAPVVRLLHSTRARLTSSKNARLVFNCSASGRYCARIWRQRAAWSLRFIACPWSRSMPPGLCRQASFPISFARIVHSVVLYVPPWLRYCQWVVCAGKTKRNEGACSSGNSRGMECASNCSSSMDIGWSENNSIKHQRATRQVLLSFFLSF